MFQKENKLIQQTKLITVTHFDISLGTHTEIAIHLIFQTYYNGKCACHTSVQISKFKMFNKEYIQLGNMIELSIQQKPTKSHQFVLTKIPHLSQ